MDLSAVRADFPVLVEGNGRDHFLDSAASSQKPRQVLEAMDHFYRTSYANVHRGAYRLSVAATESFEAARRRVAGFLGAEESEVVITRGATTSLNAIAHGWAGNKLGKGDRIVLSIMEHHANLIPWQQVANRTGAELEFVPLTDDFRLDMEAFDRALDRGAAVVAVTGMSNVLGTMPPLTEIVPKAHGAGAVVVVDGAQLVPHEPVDVAALGADFLAFSAHKMLGPTGIGVLWGRMERLEEMEPFETGGEMIADVTLDGATWAAIPHRFEAGTPPIAEAVGLHAAIEYLEGIGMDKVSAHDRELTGYALRRLSEVPDLAVQGPQGVEARGGAISFTLGDIHPHDLATILDQAGVSVRAGHHCAKPLLRHLGVTATARASFYLYNTPDDVDALIDGLHRARKLFGLG
ncbi:MAG: cysteine desulfurase [Acidimicrobiia bacterium]